MNFADIKKKLSAAQPSADPSRAFGSEAEMMEALRKQEFTPPKPRPSAAEVVGNLRQRFTRPVQRQEREDVSRTYAPEAMAQPEWENPFTAPPKPKRDAPVYETVAGDMPFERRSAAAYAPQGYAPYGGYTAAPYPPAGYEPYAPAAYSPQGYAPAPAYAPPYYDPYAAPAYDPRYAAPYPPNGYYAPPQPYPPQGYAPAPEAGYAPPPEYAAPEYPASEYDAAFYGDAVPAPEGYPAPPYTGVPRSPAAPAKPRRKPLEGADLRYLLWSGSIVSGVLLTLVAFVYACTL